MTTPTPAPRKKRRMDEFRIDEISLVDRPAQEGARVTIVKRADPSVAARVDGGEGDGAEPVRKRRILTTSDAGHSHSITTDGPGGTRLRMGTTSYNADMNGVSHTHDWVEDDAGSIIVGDSVGHRHGVAVMTMDKAKADGARRMGGSGAMTSGEMDEMDDEMDEKMREEERKRDAERKRADKAEARACTLAALSPDQFGYFKTLSADARDAFLDRPEADRNAEVAKARDADPVVYKALDGTEYRKSAGDQFIALVRMNDDLQKRLQKQEIQARHALLEKRATEELANLNGETVHKVALLDAVESIEDEGVRKAVSEMIRASAAGVGKAFERVGTSTAPVLDSSAPDVQLDAYVRKYAADTKTDPDAPDTYRKALQTPEGSKLFQAHTEFMKAGTRR